VVSKTDPVQGLIDYILDIKPYHSKVLEVLMEYIYTDAINVSISETLEIDGILSSGPHFVFCAEGWDTYPWGVLVGDLDPFNIPGDNTSGYRPYYPFGSPPGSLGHWDYPIVCIPKTSQFTVYVSLKETLTFDFFGDLGGLHINLFDRMIIALTEENLDCTPVDILYDTLDLLGTVAIQPENGVTISGLQPTDTLVFTYPDAKGTGSPIPHIAWSFYANDGLGSPQPGFTWTARFRIRNNDLNTVSYVNATTLYATAQQALDAAQAAGPYYITGSTSYTIWLGNDLNAEDNRGGISLHIAKQPDCLLAITMIGSYDGGYYGIGGFGGDYSSVDI